MAAALGALATLVAAAPAYFRQGFPLDDAWIHAVYAREFARTGMLAYNPGVPATGETSPMWAFALAVPHWMSGGDIQSAVLLTKLFGFALHVCAALLIARTLAVGSPDGFLPWIGGALVALHPDLVAASVSGMEVPLASLVIAGLAFAVVTDRWPLAGAIGAMAAVARPETPVFVVFALALAAARRDGAPLKSFLAASIGAAVAMAVVCLRNWFVSGLILPATFYAKVQSSSVMSIDWQMIGFRRLLGSIVLVDQPLILLVLVASATVLLVRHSTTTGGRTASALFLAGIMFCIVSFALVHPVDPTAFYHQRYVLPALVPIVAALPILLREMLSDVPGRFAAPALTALLIVMSVLTLVAAPERYRRLSNDTRNIDDVQVEFGRALSAARPSDIAWVVDAGAPRFFGGAYVVDLLGLNTYELLPHNPQAFLDRHQPRYLDVFAGWSSFRGGTRLADLPQREFTASTRYTVTSLRGMSRHVLVTCVPGASGELAVRTKLFAFRCPEN